jgi:hypothetical protein
MPTAPNCGSLANTNPLSCYNREFGGFWFIGGDHTGTTTAAGNAPVSATQTGGYMLVVNADLATSEAYRQVITGLLSQYLLPVLRLDQKYLSQLRHRLQWRRRVHAGSIT